MDIFLHHQQFIHEKIDAEVEISFFHEILNS